MHSIRKRRGVKNQSKLQEAGAAGNLVPMTGFERGAFAACSLAVCCVEMGHSELAEKGARHCGQAVEAGNTKRGPRAWWEGAAVSICKAMTQNMKRRTRSDHGVVGGMRGISLPDASGELLSVRKVPGTIPPPPPLADEGEGGVMGRGRRPRMSSDCRVMSVGAGMFPHSLLGMIGFSVWVRERGGFEPRGRERCTVGDRGINWAEAERCGGDSLERLD